ncbi:hypothetical protein Ddye_030270 [Dipteronia dyeriana]|uniref:Reverse transcriptase domain-containing protein n=1 Tax=Dipteronia dyeriana TaxID=168575 RepID=A0AAD9WML2_9ROSI|nr:hypothetical protein Ddye_030270 [Dipteronia dyeriana]
MAELRKKLSGFCWNRGGPKITHLFCMDDSMVFTKAAERDVRTIKMILGCYVGASGQMVNFQKLAMCVSKRVPRRRTKFWASILRVRLVECHERYLGLPSLPGKNKRELSSSIKNRVWDKVKGWQSKLFSSG